MSSEKKPKWYEGNLARLGMYVEKKVGGKKQKDTHKDETSHTTPPHKSSSASHSNSLDSKSHSMSSPERKKHIPNRPVGVDSLTTDLEARQNKPVERISRTDVARTFLHYMDVPERAAIVDQPGGAPFEHQINNYTLNEITPVLQNILSNGEDRKKLEEARTAIREQFGKDIEDLFGKNVSDWSKSDSWVYGGVAEKRLLRQRREVAKMRKLSIPEHDPLTGDGAEQEWENVGARQLGWEARFQSWKLKNVRGKMEFEFVEPNPILAKLDKARPEYKLIEKMLKRAYREPHAGEYDLKHNPPALIAENFTSDELQNLGEMIRTNLESKKAVVAEEAQKAAEAERKKDPWADAPTYGAGDQIIYRRPTGEWAVGTVVEPPEEGGRGQRKFKVTNPDGKEEEYSAAAPPRFYNVEAETAAKITIGKKEYSVTKKHMGTNRVEFDLVDETGKEIPNVDAEVVVAAHRAEEVSGKIKEQVDKLQDLVKKGVADRSTKIGTTLSSLTTRAQEVEKLLGSSSRWNKLLPERAKEIQDEITKIQSQFEVNVAELTGEVEGIHKTSEKTSESLDKKLAADQVEAAFTTRLQQLDAMHTDSDEYKNWEAGKDAYKKAHDAWVKSGDKKAPPPADPGEAPPLPSTIPQRRQALYAEVVGALSPDNAVYKELEERIKKIGNIDEMMRSDASQADIETKKQDIARAEVAQQAAQESLAKLQKVANRLQPLRDEISQDNASLATLRGEETTARDKVTKLETALEQARQQTSPDQVKQLTAAEAKDLQKKVKDKKKNKKELEEKRDEAERAGNLDPALQTQIDKLTSEITGLEGQLTSARQTRDLTKDPANQISNLETQLQNAQDALSKKTEEINQKNDELQKKQQEESGLVGELGGMGVGLNPNDIQNELTTRRNRFSAADSQLTGLNADLVRLESQASSEAAQRIAAYKGQIAEDIVKEWRGIKVEVGPRVDIAVQKDEARNKAKDLQDRISRLAPNPTIKADLEQRGIALARLVESVSTTKPADAEQAIAELWATQIRALEVDVFAQELHTKPERQGDYETLVGRTELPGALIADMLREGAPESTRDLRAILENIYEHTLEQATIKAPPNNTEYTCVKPDSKTTAMIIGLMEKAKLPDDAAVLSRFGVRQKDDLLKVWKKYAPQIGVYLQESARVSVSMEVRRKEKEELAKQQAILDAEAKKPKARFKGLLSKINPARIFRGSVAPAAPQLSAEAREELRNQARKDLKNIDLAVLFDQMGTRISAAMGRINTEFRISKASSVGEKTGILSLNGLTARDRTQAFIQGEFVMAEDEEYRLKRTVDDVDFPALQELDAAGYKKAQRDVQGAIDKMRVKLNFLYTNRRDDRTAPAYDERKKKFQDALAGLEKDSAVLVGILNRDDSADKAMVAMGNADPILYDQISSVLLEARQYLQVDATELTTPEKELISAKMREGVAKVAAATEAAKAADTTGEAAKVQEAMTEPDHGDEGHDAGGHGTGPKKKGKSDPLVRWAAVIALTASSVIGFAGYKVKKDFEADSRARIERLGTNRGGEVVVTRPDANFDVKPGHFKAPENSMKAQYANWKEYRGVETPAVASREPVLERWSVLALHKQHAKEASVIENIVHKVSMNNDGTDTPQGTKAKQTKLSDMGKGIYKLGLMCDKDGSIRSEYKSQADEVLTLAKADKVDETTEQKIVDALIKIGTSAEKITADHLEGAKTSEGISLFVEMGSSEEQASRYVRDTLVPEFKKIQKEQDEKDKKEGKKVDGFNRYNDVYTSVANIDWPVASADPKAQEAERQKYAYLLKALALRESDQNPGSLSYGKNEKGEERAMGIGILQTHIDVIHDHFKLNDKLALSPIDPTAGILEGSLELMRMMQQFGDVKRALMAYNWGPQNLRDYERWMQTPPETEDLSKIKDEAKREKKRAANIAKFKSLKNEYTGRVAYANEIIWNHKWFEANGWNSKPEKRPAPPNS